MRIIKDNTLEFPSLFTTLVTEKKNNTSRKTKISDAMTKTINKHEELFESLYTFGRKIKETNNISLINDYLKTSLNKYIEVLEIAFFNTAKDNSEPVPLTANILKSTTNFVNTIHNDGMLKSILQRGHLSIIPTRNKSSEIHSYYLVYPVIDMDRENQYFLLINTKEKHFEGGTFLRKILESFMQLFIPRIEYLLQKNDLSQTYDELQIYQSKIFNDYKLSTVGEMTYELMDQIISPMQVVLSCVDMMESKNGKDDSILNTIRTQVQKVKLITDNIAKFSNGDQTKTAILPCSLNFYINNYYEFLKSYLNKRNYEVFLDLDNNLPPILSMPNYINQILTNTFSLMVNAADTGGLYVQTKYFNNEVRIRVISTDTANIQSEEKQNINKNINLMMLETLMRRHEGSVNFNSSPEDGSSLELIFPLRRKLLQ